jgi:hypothetical protein
MEAEAYPKGRIQPLLELHFPHPYVRLGVPDQLGLRID